MQRPPPATYAVLVLTVIIWASYPTLSKIALRDLPPFTIAALRCTIASGLLVGLLLRARAAGAPGIARRDLPALAGLGFAGITVSTALYYLGVALTSASNAVILTATTPVLVVLGARLAFGEALDRPQQVGVACSACGVLLTVTRGEIGLLEATPEVGDGIVLVGQVGWAAYTLYGKPVLARVSPATATTAAYLFGTAFLVPVAVASAPAFAPANLASFPAWAVVVFQGTVGALAHVWYYRGVQAVGPAVAAVFMNLQPLVGVLLATAVLGERVTPAQVVGGLLILAGVWLTARR